MSSDSVARAAAPRALVLLADGAEEMEVTIAVDVLRRAEVDVVLAGVDGAGAVTCSRGVRLLPDAALSAVDGAADGAFDVVVLPGGVGGTDRLCASGAVGAVLAAHEGAGRDIAAICAAARALVVHGVGAGRALTSHPSVRAEVAGHGAYDDAARVVEDGPLITSRGPGTAFEFALALVARLRGTDVAAAVRAPMLLGEP